MPSLSVLPGVLPTADAAPVVAFGDLDPLCECVSGGVVQATWASETRGGESGSLQRQADALPALVRADPLTGCSRVRLTRRDRGG